MRQRKREPNAAITERRRICREIAGLLEERMLEQRPDLAPIFRLIGEGVSLEEEASMRSRSATLQAE